MRIKPFRGFRYAGAPSGDLTRVVAPPYDQIGPEAQAQLYALSPHNIVRVTLPQDEPGADRYRRAREVLDAWLAEGTWVAEERPAIYPY